MQIKNAMMQIRKAMMHIKKSQSELVQVHQTTIAETQALFYVKKRKLNVVFMKLLLMSLCNCTFQCVLSLVSSLIWRDGTSAISTRPLP